MHFTQGDSTYIVAEGEITENTPAEFGLITSPGTAIYFDSPGGSLGAALTLGRMIRRAGLNTYVAPRGLVAPQGIQIITVETAQKWGLDNSRAGVTRPAASTGSATADLFHLRSECNALGEQMFQDTVNSAADPAEPDLADKPDDSEVRRRMNQDYRRWLQTAEGPGRL
jgi:hypothetical protein